MTREECERKIADKFVEIAEIYKEYNSNDNNLYLYMHDNFLSVNNSYFKEGYKDGILNFSVFNYIENKEVYSF